MTASLGDIYHFGEEIREGTMVPYVGDIGLYEAIFEFDVGVLRAEEVVVFVELEICEKNHFLKS